MVSLRRGRHKITCNFPKVYKLPITQCRELTTDWKAFQERLFCLNIEKEKFQKPFHHQMGEQGFAIFTFFTSISSSQPWSSLVSAQILAPSRGAFWLTWQCNKLGKMAGKTKLVPMRSLGGACKKHRDRSLRSLW